MAYILHLKSQNIFWSYLSYPVAQELTNYGSQAKSDH